jgi:hypothetical protein
MTVSRFGGPEVLTLREVPGPVAGTSASRTSIPEARAVVGKTVPAVHGWAA